MAPYTTIIAIAWAVFVVYWLAASFFSKRSTASRFAGKSGWIRIGLLVVFLFIFSNWHGVYDLADPSLPLEALGAALAVCGVAFAIWARIYLGSNWGMPMTERVDHELVTSGPYRYVRHPIYTGAFFAMLGSALVSPWWTIMLVALTIYFAYSAFEEEKTMLAKFPQAYADYIKRSKRFIPFIY